MRSPTRWTALLAGSTLVLGMAAFAPLGATAEESANARPSDPGALLSEDTRELGPGYRQNKRLPIDRQASQEALQQARADRMRARPQVGTQKTWLALDDELGEVYLKRYQLRGVGDNIQVWVANDRAFPLNDCRNDLGLVDVTQRQVDRFVREFDRNIYPKESRVFSTPPDRNGGASAALAADLGLPENYWRVGRRAADDIVVLVDNVRDTNFYDPLDENGKTYIAGFFFGLFNELLDRNIMTIDVFDWLHRTGQNPPNDLDDPAYVACNEALESSRPFGEPRPRLYEGTFAHEYQHLLEYYEDTDEVNWVNEGLSDWAQTLVGYVNPRIPPSDPRADGHMSCFLGFLDPASGGPENSLTLWEDQGAPEILCDYGAAYTMMEYLHSKYGTRFMTRLHRVNANGLEGLDRVLDRSGVKASAQTVLRRWAAMVAIDARLDANGKRLRGSGPGKYTAKSLRARINWSNPEAYSDPGAPPNGSDYVRLRGADGNLSAAEVESVAFQGAAELTPLPLEWEVDPTPPDATVPATDTDPGTVCEAVSDGTGAAALYSGCGPNLDRSIVREVTLPAGAPQLTFDALWDLEAGFDFAFLQISADGGETWQSVPTNGTTTEGDPGADPAITSQLPGFTGDSETWQTQTADLSDFAGQPVLLGFRFMTDPLVNEGGFWVRNMSVDGQALPTDALAGWQSMTQANPPDVRGWTVRLVAYGDRDDPVWYHRMRLDGSFTGTLEGADLRRAIGSRATLVGAIVMQDDPTETVGQQALYSLTVNGVVQPGGGLTP